MILLLKKVDGVIEAISTALSFKNWSGLGSLASGPFSSGSIGRNKTGDIIARRKVSKKKKKKANA